MMLCCPDLRHQVLAVSCKSPGLAAETYRPQHQYRGRSGRWKFRNLLVPYSCRSHQPGFCGLPRNLLTSHPSDEITLDDLKRIGGLQTCK